MNTNLCNNTYLLSPPTAAAQEKYTSFQTLYIEYCMNTVHSNFHSSQTLYFPIISHFQEYFTLVYKHIFTGHSEAHTKHFLSKAFQKGRKLRQISNYLINGQ